MTFAALAIDMQSRPAKRMRRTTGTYVGGKFIAGAPATVDIAAVIQPAAGRHLEDMPEGVRAEARYLIWSRAELLLEDRIPYKGGTYRIIHVWDRSEDNFYRAAMGLTTE